MNLHWSPRSPFVRNLRHDPEKACLVLDAGWDPVSENGVSMPRSYQPDLGASPDSPFVRDGNDKLIRRSYLLDMDDRTLVMLMSGGIGANLTNDEKRAHLIDQVCPREILPPEELKTPFVI